MGKWFREGSLKDQRFKEMQVLWQVIHYIDNKYMNDSKMIFGEQK